MAQSVALGPIPLEKYSFALSNENVRHHVWSHDARRELLLLKVVRVESIIGGRLGDGGLQVLVVAGSDCLERLDSEALIHYAREHEQRLRQGLVSAQTEPPVQVVVKFPCIAMRYPDQAPMVRRFQLKFQSESDYLTVRDLLRDLGFPIKESASTGRPASRASAAASSTSASRLASSSPAIGNWQRSSLSHSQSPLGLGSSSHHGYQFPSISSRAETSSVLSMRPPSIFSPDIERLRSSSALDSTSGRPSPSNDLRFQPPAPARTLHSPPIFNRNQSTHGQQYGIQSSPLHPQETDQMPPRPDSNTIAWSQLSQTHAERLRDSDHDRIGDEAHNSTLHRDRVISYGENSSSQFFSEGMRLKRSTTALSSQVSNAPGYEPLSQVRHHSLVHESMHRPLSTPLTGSQYDISRLDTTSWMPPKRDLPFPKPKEAKNAEAPVAAARRVSFSELEHQETRRRTVSPELGLTTVASSTSSKEKTPPPPPPPQPAAKPARKRAPARKKTAVAPAPSREIPDSLEKATRTPSALPGEPVSPLASRGSAIARQATAPPGKTNPQSRKRTAGTVIAPPAKAAKMVDNSTQTKTGSGRNHTALPRSATVTQPIPAAEVDELPAPAAAAALPATRTVQPMQQATPQPTAEELNGIGDHMENFIERLARPRRPVEIYELPGWDTVTGDDRHDMVEDWMIEQLQDPKFVELCRTMDGTWQRIGIP